MVGIMTISTRIARPMDRAEWLRMRKALWDDCPDERQELEIDEILSSETDVVLFAERPGGGLCGFLEASLRSRADGCDSSPVGYIEGWYVDPDMRRNGSRLWTLAGAAEAWGTIKRLPADGLRCRALE